jgi:hypothetical protein
MSDLIHDPKCIGSNDLDPWQILDGLDWIISCLRRSSLRSQLTKNHSHYEYELSTQDSSLLRYRQIES